MPVDWPSAFSEIFPERIHVEGGPLLNDSMTTFQIENTAVKNFAPSRKLEFMSGRFYARKAIARLGGLPAAIPRLADGCPRWPEGFVGSITHTKLSCAAAAARIEDYRSIGIDIEVRGILESRLISKIMNSHEERDFISVGKSPEHDGISIFSAKEAVFKAVYPVFKKFLGFEDIEIFFISDSQFVARVRCWPEWDLTGQVASDEKQIIAAVFISSECLFG